MEWKQVPIGYMLWYRSEMSPKLSCSEMTLLEGNWVTRFDTLMYVIT